MESRVAVWGRLPLIVRAAVVGLSITALAGVVWTALVAANLSTTTRLPWSVPVMALALWLLWRYLSGHGWPARTAGLRRSYLRAGNPSARVWLWSLLAGTLAIVSLTSAWIVVGRLLTTPARQLPDLSAFPRWVVLAFVVMSAVVAAISEEAGFRGYAQVPLERRHGPTVAILVSSLVFAAAHLGHGVFLPALLLYFLGGVMWGVTAYLAGSILPGVVLHAAVNIAFFLLARQADETRSLVWESGADPGFWMRVLLTLVLGGLAVAAYRRLASVRATGGPARSGG